jgi:aminoglycoside phosphotransferase (APT) family kinase protein
MVNTGTLTRAIAKTCPHIAERITGFSPITTGKFNTSHYVHTHEKDYVLRIAPDPHETFVFYEKNMMKQEPGLHRIIRENTDVPVARIYTFDESHTDIPRDFLLMERLPGEPVSQSPVADTDRVLYEVGQALARVHAITAQQYGYLGPHRPMPPQDTWVDAFALMWDRMIGDIEALGYYSPREAQALRRFFEDHRSLFDRDVPARLLHMDVWAQNILVDAHGGLSGLVDWDRALWGDPEIEFAVLDYCGISTPPFWEGYGTPRDESHDARIRTFFYLLYEVQKYIVIRGGRNKRPTTARAYKQQVLHMIKESFDVAGL